MNENAHISAKKKTRMHLLPRLKNSALRWRRHPFSALMRLVSALCMAATIIMLLDLVADILIKGIPNIRPELFSDKVREMHELRTRIDREIHTITGIRVNVELVKPQTLERFVGKSKRVIDHRTAS